MPKPAFVATAFLLMVSQGYCWIPNYAAIKQHMKGPLYKQKLVPLRGMLIHFAKKSKTSEYDFALKSIFMCSDTVSLSDLAGFDLAVMRN